MTVAQAQARVARAQSEAARAEAEAAHIVAATASRRAEHAERELANFHAAWTEVQAVLASRKTTSRDKGKQHSSSCRSSFRPLSSSSSSSSKSKSKSKSKSNCKRKRHSSPAPSSAPEPEPPTLTEIDTPPQPQGCGDSPARSSVPAPTEAPAQSTKEAIPPDAVRDRTDSPVAGQPSIADSATKPSNQGNQPTSNAVRKEGAMKLDLSPREFDAPIKLSANPPSSPDRDQNARNASGSQQVEDPPDTDATVSEPSQPVRPNKRLRTDTPAHDARAPSSPNQSPTNPRRAMLPPPPAPETWAASKGKSIMLPPATSHSEPIPQQPHASQPTKKESVGGPRKSAAGRLDLLDPSSPLPDLGAPAQPQPARARTIRPVRTTKRPPPPVTPGSKPRARTSFPSMAPVTFGKELRPPGELSVYRKLQLLPAGASTTGSSSASLYAARPNPVPNSHYSHSIPFPPTGAVRNRTERKHMIGVDCSCCSEVHASFPRLFFLLCFASLPSRLKSPSRRTNAAKLYTSSGSNPNVGH